MDRGAWWVTVHGITKSQTQVNRLSMHAPIPLALELKKKKKETVKSLTTTSSLLFSH